MKDMEGELKGAVLGAEEGVRGVGEGVEAGEGGKDTKGEFTVLFNSLRKLHCKKISVFAFVNFLSLLLVANM